MVYVWDSLDISADYSKPGANYDAYNAIGYGYQWWVPEGNAGELCLLCFLGKNMTPSTKLHLQPRGKIPHAAAHSLFP